MPHTTTTYIIMIMNVRVCVGNIIIITYYVDEWA